MNQLGPSTRLRLENQVAVVTGGARGIGAGIVRRFVEEGARVVFSDLLADKGQALEGELGQHTAFYRADAASPSDCEALMNFAVERFGGLDCVVNNAGAGAEGGPIAGISVEGFDRAIALLLRGPFLGIKYAVPHMKSGTIINIAIRPHSISTRFLSCHHKALFPAIPVPQFPNSARPLYISRAGPYIARTVLWRSIFRPFRRTG